jgi:hypothetical protein
MKASLPRKLASLGLWVEQRFSAALKALLSSSALAAEVHALTFPQPRPVVPA